MLATYLISSRFNSFEFIFNCSITFGIISSNALLISAVLKSFRLLTNAVANTVEVEVPSPASSTVFLAASLSNCTPMFSIGSFNVILLITLTPSLVTLYCPYLPESLIITVLPFGPSVAETALQALLIPDNNLSLTSLLNVISSIIFIFLYLT